MFISVGIQTYSEHTLDDVGAFFQNTLMVPLRLIGSLFPRGAGSFGGVYSLLRFNFRIPDKSALALFFYVISTQFVNKCRCPKWACCISDVAGLLGTDVRFVQCSHHSIAAEHSRV